MGASAGAVAGIAVSLAGVVMISMTRVSLDIRDIARQCLELPALLGLASGALFGVSAVAYRAASLSLDDGNFHWRWRGMLRRKSLDLPLQRIVRVRREAVESRDSGDSVYRFRLVVVLDDDSVVGLTRSYSRIHKRKLELIVEDIREYLGHVVPMP